MMTPEQPPLARWPEEQATNPPELAGPQIRAVDGNRAALVLLVVQNIVSALLIGQLRLGLGAALLLSFLATVAAGFIFFRPALQALFSDTRWRTPPSLGTALAGFLLGFIASRAFALVYVTLVPSAAGSMPQFLSHGYDMWLLLLSAGILVPLAEEVAFRGLMMRGHERATTFLTAAITTSFAFAIAHGVPASIAGIVPLAYVLARIVQHTGSLWNAVIIHVLNNTLSVALGAFLAGKNLAKADQATELLKGESLRLPLAAGAALFGVAIMVVVHLWMTPKPDDPQVGQARGPWLSGAYVVIVLFGLAAIALGIPAVQQSLTSLRGFMQ